MPPTRLDVYLNDTLVGSLNDLSGERNIFVFDEDYLAAENRPTLSLGFKGEGGTIVQPRRSHQVRLDPFFSNLLPEGKLREYVAELADIHPDREYPLINLVGEDLPGAVIVRPSDLGPPATKILEPENGAVDSNGKPGTPSQAPLKFSLAGVQLKFSAVKETTGGLTIPAFGSGGAWIAKLPSETFEYVAENEYWMMLFAKEVGLHVPEIGLIDYTDIRGLPEGIRKNLGKVFIIRRFDREKGHRVHIEDFAQIRRVYPERKYRGGSYRNILEILCLETNPNDIREFIARLVFNAAIGNGDMHLKNWSLIYPDGRTPSLAPGYDFLSTLLYVTQEETMALNIVNTKKFNELSAELLKRLADNSGVSSGSVLVVARQTAERIRDVWPTFKLEIDLPEKFISAIDNQMTKVPILNERAAAIAS